MRRSSQSRLKRGMMALRTHKSWRLSAAALITAAALAGCMLRSPGTDTGTGPTASSHGLTSPEPTPSSTTDATLAASDLSQKLHGRPEFSSVATDPAGTGLVLYWYGPEPASELSALAATYPEVVVEVYGTDYLPRDLQDLASDLLIAEEASGVGAVSVRPDGSGLDVFAHGSLSNQSLAAMEVRLSESTGVPVTVESGAPVPAM